MTILHRRDFGRLIAISAWAVNLPLAELGASSPGEPWLLEQVPGGPGLRLPNKSGHISIDERNRLKELFAMIGISWGMESTGVGEREFSDLVDLKTSETPSYLTEYSEAAEILTKFTSKDFAPTGSLAKLLFQPSDSSSFETTRLGRFKRYVFSEFITWWVTQGGYQRFGYATYRGFMKGPFTDPTNPPFRTIN
jgi:hypothetical protein